MGRSSSAATAARRKASEASSDTGGREGEADLPVDGHHVGLVGRDGVGGVAPDRRGAGTAGAAPGWDPRAGAGATRRR